MRLIIASLMLGAAAPVVSIAAWAQPAPATARIDGEAAAAEVRRALARNYVLPEVRPKLDAALAKGLAEGRYNVSDPAELVQRINADLAAVTPDKHLGLQYDPAGAASLAAQPPGAGADDAPPTAEDIRTAQRGNHGIVEMKLLPGNIRYLNSNGFVWAGATSAEAYDGAMRFLRDGDAAIIDLRHNGGGSPDAVQYMISHFVEANRPLVTFHMGAEGVSRLSSLATLPAGRMVGKPLYVLTSGMTASAAEEFTGHVAGYKLGEIIGDTTAGAGFRNEFFPIPGGFTLSVSVGRAVLVSTGKDWEAVGIAPTTKVEAGKALELAQVHALRRIAATATPQQKAALEASAAVLSAKLNPVQTALPLAAYAGTFGERTVTLENGRLVFRRGGGPKFAIVPIDANQFAFEDAPGERLTYSVAGNVATGFELLRGDGSRVTAYRTQ
ncbi:MAG TPA: S41 family peptidase [Sphingomicrobium sp.]|nr:S41 family peptidase [Sphingomicrobium sp.]